MAIEYKKEVKRRLHIRNKNRKKYDLTALIAAAPELADHLKPNKLGEDSVDFANPVAVKLLNKALLNHYYGISNWDFPDENLCPPIPGRADYLHYMADLLAETNFGTIPTGDKIKGLDVGVGASCIYPILGITEYGWSFIGSEIDRLALESAQQIVDANPSLEGKIELRIQKYKNSYFHGILQKEEKVDFTICNPPFHSSTDEAEKGSRRKVKNLTGKKVETPPLNFAGIQSELTFEGGEYAFIHAMISESKKFSKSCFWFSTLVSKKSNLKGINKSLEKMEVKQIKTIPMGTGNKSSRIVAWTFLNKDEQKEWKESRWKKDSAEIKD